NQVPHRFPRPQIKRQLQLIRATIFDHPANHLLALGAEPAADGTTALSCPQRFYARMLLEGDPSMNRLTRYPKNIGHVRLGAPFFEGGHRLEANLFLNLRSQGAEIAM